MSSANHTFRFRESRRLLHEAAVRLDAPGEGGELSGWTRDIATGGMFVSTPTPLPVGTAARFLLQLGSDDEPADVEGEATVVWVRLEAAGADQPAGMGMHFGRVEPPGEERLAWLFSERQGEGDVIPPAPSREPENVEVQQAEVQRAEAEGGEAAAATVVIGAHGEGPDAIEQASPARDAKPAPAEIVQAESAAPPVPGPPEHAPPEPPASEPPGEDRPSDDPPLAAEDAVAGSEVGTTHAELFGELAEDGDGDDWMKPESRSRPWLWPAVGGVVLLAVLFAFRGPLANLFGPGDAPAEEGASPDAPGFDVSTPPAGAEVPPEGAQEVIPTPRAGADVPAERGEEVVDSSTASPLSTPREEEATDAEAAGGGAAAEPVAADEPADASPTEAAEAVVAERPDPAPPTRTVETGPAAEPVSSDPAAVSRPSVRPSAPAAPPPVNATALRSISASTAGDRTVIEIVGNAPFKRHHVMPLEAPPRLLVRLIGVQQDFDARAVRGPRLRGVRTGVHGRGATRNLHVVFDLAASDIAATVERRGERVVVNLSD